MEEESMQNQKKSNILDHGVAQIGILVKDLDATVKRYHEVFGIGPWHFYTYEKPLVNEMTYYGKPANYSMRLALSYFGPMRIELIEPGVGESVYHDFVNEHGYGIHHLGLLTSNMEDSIRKAKSAGIEMIMDGAGFGLDGDGHYAYLDTEKDFGVTLELIERPKGRLQPEQFYPPE
jgi:catechol 2,3-dioxygenase-like lactoylglutathione lyase family enzyme